MSRRTTILTAILAAVCCSSAMAAGKPLKVYILAGQSNMQGHVKVSNLSLIGEDSRTAPLAQDIFDADGKPRMCDKVWISLFGGDESGEGEKIGNLTTGFGVNDQCIGPEFAFGIYMQKLLNEPILIIKTAWGGKSLSTDFRPPSAGPYVISQECLKWPVYKNKEYLEEQRAKRAKATRRYYYLMMNHIKKVLADPKRVCPVYDEEEGYELAGLVWLQGWNDWCDDHTYPRGHQPGGYDQYTELLAHFIRDVRKELSAPKMRFVIGVMGHGGPIEDFSVPGKENHKHFRAAMAAPAAMDEFKGNVVAVPTAPYWNKALSIIQEKRNTVSQMGWYLRTKHKDHPNKDGTMTKEEQQAYIKEFRAKLITPEEEAFYRREASNGGLHYFGSGKTLVQIGKAFAEAMLEMEKK